MGFLEEYNFTLNQKELITKHIQVETLGLYLIKANKPQSHP